MPPPTLSTPLNRLTPAPSGIVNALTWLQANFDAPSDWASPEALAADLTGCGKGHVYINGFDARRYWIRDAQLSAVYQLPPDHIKTTSSLQVKGSRRSGWSDGMTKH